MRRWPPKTARLSHTAGERGRPRCRRSTAAAESRRSRAPSGSQPAVLAAAPLGCRILSSAHPGPDAPARYLLSRAHVARDSPWRGAAPAARGEEQAPESVAVGSRKVAHCAVPDGQHALRRPHHLRRAHCLIGPDRPAHAVRDCCGPPSGSRPLPTATCPRLRILSWARLVDATGERSSKYFHVSEPFATTRPRCVGGQRLSARPKLCGGYIQQNIQLATLISARPSPVGRFDALLYFVAV